jgi:hypothetical protein
VRCKALDNTSLKKEAATVSENLEARTIKRKPPPPLTHGELAKIQHVDKTSLTVTLTGDEALILERWFYEMDEVRESFQFDDRANYA